MRIENEFIRKEETEKKKAGAGDLTNDPARAVEIIGVYREKCSLKKCETKFF